jgi:CubicO group peptidase (beta-lactamase class C family)
MLLSGVIEKVTGKNVYAYAKEKIFDPIGMEPIHWWEDGRGHTLTYCCIDTTSRNFARFGLLFLQEGKWEDETVVPASWVEKTTTRWEAAPRYGMQWWVKGADDPGFYPDDMFYANGNDGQFIFVMPSLDLVVVRNGIYIKWPDEPVAPHGMTNRLAAGNHVEYMMSLDLEAYGTLEPDSWSNPEFLKPIIDSIQDN